MYQNKKESFLNKKTCNLGLIINIYSSFVNSILLLKYLNKTNAKQKNIYIYNFSTVTKLKIKFLIGAFKNHIQLL